MSAAMWTEAEACGVGEGVAVVAGAGSGHQARRRPRRGRWSTALLTALVTLGSTGVAACSDDPPTTPSWNQEVELKVAFVGNSLTYTNDLPGVFAVLAAAAGLDVATHVIANPNWSLEEHWKGGTPAGIRALQADLVVMQQGPSTLLSSREHLLAWGDSMTRVVREAGSVPAFMMVWPPDDPDFSFGAVLASYRAAAELHQTMFVPAGVAWLEAWEEDPGLRLWGQDGFHPSLRGTVAVALTLVHQLCGEIGPIQETPLAISPAETTRLSAAAKRAATAFGFAASEGALTPECR